MIYKVIEDKKYEYDILKTNFLYGVDLKNELNALGQEGWKAISYNEDSNSILLMREFVEVDEKSTQINS